MSLAIGVCDVDVAGGASSYTRGLEHGGDEGGFVGDLVEFFWCLSSRQECEWRG